MDEVLPRPSAEAQKELLDRIRSQGNEMNEDVADEFKADKQEQKW